METLTFEQFEDQVMAALEDWPIVCSDRSDSECVYFAFTALSALGPTGFYDGQWYVSARWNPERMGVGETLEGAIADMNKTEVN